MIKTWKQSQVTLTAGIVTPFTPTTNANIVQIINRLSSGGGIVYADDPTNSRVSSTYYGLKVEQGNTGAIVRPYKLNTVYLTTDAGAPITVTIIEVESPDLSFVFNASEVLQIQGAVQVTQPVQVSGTVELGAGTAAIGHVAVDSLPANTAIHFTASQLVKNGAGTIEKIIVGKGVAASTVTLYDNTAASGTILAVIDAANPVSIEVDAAVATGIYAAVAGGTPDVTVVYR